MSSQPPASLTRLINRMFLGDESAGNAAMNELYPALRRIARGRLRHERPGHILDTTALVNEALTRLFGTNKVVVKDRQHFYALACLSMKRILIDAGRRPDSDAVFVALDDTLAAATGDDRERMLSIQRILDRFTHLDREACHAIVLNVGAGMTSAEIAEKMSCSVPTVNRRLKRARVWLFKELRSLATHRAAGPH